MADVEPVIGKDGNSSIPASILTPLLRPRATAWRPATRPSDRKRTDGRSLQTDDFWWMKFGGVIEEYPADKSIRAEPAQGPVRQRLSAAKVKASGRASWGACGHARSLNRSWSAVVLPASLAAALTERHTSTSRRPLGEGRVSDMSCRVRSIFSAVPRRSRFRGSETV